MAELQTSSRIVSRQEARKLGLKRYFTGKLCKRGHYSARLVSTCQCCECLYIGLRDKRAADREWARAVDRAWKSKNRDRINENERRRYARNPGKFVQKVQRQYWASPERKKANRRQRYANLRSTPELYAIELQNNRARVQRWVVENPDKARRLRQVQAQRRRARERNIAGSFTRRDLERLFKLQCGKCAYCRVKLGRKHHVDHIVPVAKGGTNDPSNLQLLCIPCNRKKAARDPLDFARLLGLLV